MPLPVIDNRGYRELVDEALGRIPIHNPEWTNFNRSDPGVTLIELFAFMTDSMLYRANQIPERNRRKFLSLLGVPLQPAASSRGIVTFANDRGPRRTLTLGGGIELLAGAVPFRTDAGLDVAPVEARTYVKRKLAVTTPELEAYYRELYASYRRRDPLPTELSFYETVPLETIARPPERDAGIDLVTETADRSLWIALLLRKADAVSDESREETREMLAGKILNVGVVPVGQRAAAALTPLGRERSEPDARLDFELPDIPATGSLGDAGQPQYRALDTVSDVDVLERPGVVQLRLPDSAAGLRLWDDIDPIEAGVGDLPPGIDDPKLADRVVTWLRVRAGAGAHASLVWAGINAIGVSQRAQVSGEALPAGTGAPDQVVTLTRTPVIPESVHIQVSAGGTTREWTRIDDLLSAAPEVPVSDLSQPPGTPQPDPDPERVEVFTVDAASGTVRFGDGMHGARPPRDARMRADYDYGLGREGNVGAGAIKSGPALPAGLKVTNPVRTWGGTEAETVTEGEKQVTRYLQHRDRLVAAADFETIAKRAPGVDIGRVDVIPAYNPELAPSAAGDAAGAVTLMVLPRYDLLRPDAPEPDRPFLDALCAYLDPRRLVTSEVFLRGPTYVSIAVSIGIDVDPGNGVAEVREAVKRALARFLSPLPSTDQGPASFDHADTGWPRQKPVVALELMAQASRVDGVRLVRPVLLARDGTGESDQIELSGLELPRLDSLAVTAGDPVPLDRAAAPEEPGRLPDSFVPVPVVPETC